MESTNKLAKIKLTPCAHCGSTNIKLIRTIEHDNVFWHVACTTCGIHTLKFDETIDGHIASTVPEVKQAMYDAITYATENWNARPIEGKESLEVHTESLDKPLVINDPSLIEKFLDKPLVIDDTTLIETYKNIDNLCKRIKKYIKSKE